MCYWHKPSALPIVGGVDGGHVAIKLRPSLVAKCTNFANEFVGVWGNVHAAIIARRR
jgi:hypothetical protein